MCILCVAYDNKVKLKDLIAEHKCGWLIKQERPDKSAVYCNTEVEYKEKFSDKGVSIREYHIYCNFHLNTMKQFLGKKG